MSMKTPNEIIEEQQMEISTLQTSLTTALAERDAAREHELLSLESDSIVASCNCLVKSNDIQFHKKGCKYRLIEERDNAVSRISELEASNGKLREELGNIATANTKDWKDDFEGWAKSRARHTLDLTAPPAGASNTEGKKL